ncbi:hypothetical protein F5X68DRAFT_172290 [Plectosphaerella plurivora]|uniref:Rhodopsin domain-containing protein n=1 Tax=Plectosphaerella plurivora TaxID=936078 RepID=A0A9P8V7D9_9PEZI|nr:hypothetical protein F5X68DRAFT_172290 [Plectosphaerella plurivora]
MTPGMSPPGDLKSNFNAPYNSVQISNIVAFGITYLFATVALGLRCFQAVKLTKKIEVDLVIITISYGLSLTYFVTMINLMNWGWGQHLWDVSVASLMEMNKALLPNTLAYLICPSITKLAILAVLYQIDPSIAYRASVGAVAVAIFIYTLACCVITGGPCSPLKDGTLQCLENIALSHAVLNISSDLAVIIIPIPTIHCLQLSLKQKLSIGCILAPGSLVTVCSIARLPYAIILPTTEDATYTQAILGIWSITEINLGIICACAMRFKSLIRTYMPKLGIFSSGPRGAAASKTTSEGLGQSFRSKSGPGAHQHAYELHSVQKSSAHVTSESKENQSYGGYRTETDGKSVGGDSADKILT